MRFGKTLRTSVYPPWKDKYIDYGKLKSLLREDNYEDDGEAWTEEDEKRFCDEIFNVQLEKVAQFQQEQVDVLKEKVNAAFDKLKELASAKTTTGEADDKKEAEDGADGGTAKEMSAEDVAQWNALEKELDAITKEVTHLKRYSTINYTGFLKIVKKHDRKRGDRYRVRPMMQLSLAQRPFNSETGYSPLLHKLSMMYFAIRQQLERDTAGALGLEMPAEVHDGEKYTAHKFWVHPDDLLEVKTLILRRLPSLVYSEHSAKQVDGNDSPSITSLYFDGPKFDLYSNKVDRQSESSSFRLRWYEQLSSRPEIFAEEKFADPNGDAREYKFTFKDKNVQPFLDGSYSVAKKVQKMKSQGQTQEEIDKLEATVHQIQTFVRENNLSPVLRANYQRTAFQKPNDDRVRISIDNDLVFIREDTLDPNRPCRDPGSWHRTDIDDANMSFPFKGINQSELSRFPYAILEIKLKEDGTRKRPRWVEDLMTSHLIHACPRFSKFVHGVASLFEDYVNSLPFWLSDLEGDIRRDPQQAFEEEEQRRAQRAEDEMAVGSLMGVKSGSYKMAQSSPVGKSYLSERMSADSKAHLSRSVNGGRQSIPSQQDEEGESSTAQTGSISGAAQRDGAGYGTMSSILPRFSLTKYARARRAQEARLPEGVVKPGQWIKNAGEVKVEPKVWLANERTFLKWQHICILQGSLAVGLYSAAGKDLIAEVMGIAYIAIAAFAGLWGYYMLTTRRAMIMERSGRDFDNMIGPIVISIALMVALILNFVLQYRAAVARMSEGV